MNKTNLIIGIIASIALILGIIGIIPKSVQLSGTTADDWNVGGALSVTGAGTITGAATLSSTLAVSATSTLTDSLLMTKTGGLIAIGTSTPATTLDIRNANTTSTVYIYSGGTSVGGRIVLESLLGDTCLAITYDGTGLATSTATCGALQR